MFRDPRPFSDSSSEPPPLVQLPHPRRRLTRRQIISMSILALLLLSGIIGGWNAVKVLFHTQAASQAPKLTLQQFLQQGKPYYPSVGPHVLPNGSQALSFWKLPTTQPTPLPSAEPLTIQPMSQTLSSAFLTVAPGSASAASISPMHLVGTDAQGTRLEVIVPAGALNVSQAKTIAGTTPQGSLSLTLSEIHGHFAATTNMLGTFQVHVTDAQGAALQAVSVRTPITFIYHYQPGELDALDLDPGKLFMVWTDRIAAQTAAKQPLTGDVIPMQNNATTSTLTAQSSVLDAGTLVLGASTPQNLSPPTPHFASVSGNSG